MGGEISSKPQKTTKRVVDIILNSNHQSYTSPDDIGIILFTDEKTKENPKETKNLPRAQPLNRGNFQTPLIGELVNITSYTSNDYYPDIGGNPNRTTNYYEPAINIHNNAGSNALPLTTTQITTQKDKTRESTPNFTFQKEFRTKGSQSVVVAMCNDYLFKLGLGGRNDPRSPNYTLFQEANGDYILRLDDSKKNEKKLGKYYKENPGQNNLNPSEGSSIIQGKNGQRINMMTTGPNGSNSISRGVTKDESDGNPNMGDRALVISLGSGDSENITADACSIYMLSNQNLPIDAASNNADSTKSTFVENLDPLEQISKPPIDNIIETLPIEQPPKSDGIEFNLVPEDQLSVESIDIVKETVQTPILSEDDPFNDPVFDALDEAIEEGFFTEMTPEEFELDGKMIMPEGEIVFDGEIVYENPNISIVAGEDPAIQINPNKFGDGYPGISKSNSRGGFDETFHCRSFKKHKFTLRDNSVTKEDVMKYVASGDLIMVADANLFPKKFTKHMDSAILLDKKYYLHKACAPAFLSWIAEMDQLGIYYVLTSALRYAKNTGGGPHGLGLAVDFGNLFGELADYGGERGDTTAAVNKRCRIGSQAYKDIATTGAKYGFYNPWRLCRTFSEVWHFEYWGEPLA